MKPNVKEVLQKLLGKPELVEQFEQEVDAVQKRAAEEAMVTRGDGSNAENKEQDNVSVTTATTQVAQQVTTTTDRQSEGSEQSEALVIQDLRGRVQRLEETLEGVMEAFGIVNNDHTMRIGRLETAETQRKAAWLADLPAYRRQKPVQSPTIYRPRTDTAEGNMPASERADAILASKNKRGWEVPK